MSDTPLWVRRLEAGLLLPLAAGLRPLSPRMRVACGHALGRLAHTVDAGHRRVARENVAAALGVAPDEAARIARGAFLHFGRVLAECLCLPAYASGAGRAVLRVSGFERLEAAHALGRGVIVFSAHFGNWELVALQQAQAGVPMDLIGRPLDNPWLEAALARGRESTGNRVIHKKGALRAALRTLKQRRGLAIMIDQNVRVPPRLWVPFFGRIAATTPSLAHLAIRTGAPVVPVVSYPLADGGYRIEYEEELAVDGTGDFDASVRDLTLRATRRIEDWIAGCPEAWFWLHNRWKSRPEPGEETT